MDIYKCAFQETYSMTAHTCFMRVSRPRDLKAGLDFTELQCIVSFWQEVHRGKPGDLPPGVLFHTDVEDGTTSCYYRIILNIQSLLVHCDFGWFLPDI